MNDLVISRKKLNKLREQVRFAKGQYELRCVAKCYVATLTKYPDDANLKDDLQVLDALIKMEK